MKKARKVSLIDVRDCPRQEYSAHWHIVVLGDDAEGYVWKARIEANQPVGYLWKETVHPTWPTDVPKLAYPSDAHLARDDAYAKMSPSEQAVERAKQDAHRAACAAIYEKQPKAVHLLAEETGTADTRDEADTAAQEWVRKEMKKHRRPKAAPVASYAIPLPVDPLADMARDLFDELRLRWRKYVRPLLALGYAQAVRHSRLHAVRDAIDAGAGAGLLRIYDGSRPATCGAATTLGAELTYTDPCAGAAAGGALTFSAITQDASANASITATWFRSVDSTGTCVEDGNVGTSGSDLNLNTTTIPASSVVQVSSKVTTGGNA